MHFVHAHRNWPKSPKGKPHPVDFVIWISKFEIQNLATSKVWNRNQNEITKSPTTKIIYRVAKAVASSKFCSFSLQEALSKSWSIESITSAMGTSFNKDSLWLSKLLFWSLRSLFRLWYTYRSPWQLNVHNVYIECTLSIERARSTVYVLRST